MVEVCHNYHETGKYIRLSSTRIYECGVFYRLLQIELDTGKIDKEIIKNSFNLIKGNYKNEVSFPVQLKNIVYDYTAWKKAWNYDHI